MRCECDIIDFQYKISNRYSPFFDSAAGAAAASAAGAAAAATPPPTGMEASLPRPRIINDNMSSS